VTPATSLADRLVCLDCWAAYPLDYRLDCPVCRGLLDEAAPPKRAGTMFDYASLARLVEERLAR
jgi:hypothetical protein